MTVNEAITQVSNLKPHQYSDEQLTAWLSKLDASIYEEIVKWHEGTELIPHGPYDISEDADVTLMVPFPYDYLYLTYLQAQIDYWNGDMARYNNSMIMYNIELQSYADHLNRDVMPIQANYIKGVN